MSAQAWFKLLDLCHAPPDLGGGGDMAKVEMRIKVRPEEKLNLEQIAKLLAAKGLADISVSERFGLIHGMFDDQRERELYVPGVERVATAQHFKVAAAGG
jgi:hypothetical protein